MATYVSRDTLMARPWIEKLARLGYAAKGLIYVTAGLLTAEAGMHRGGTTADRRDALRFIGRQPFGRSLLAIIAIGLTGYALWRIISAATDADQHGSDMKGLAIRAASVVRGVFYGAFAYTVVRMLRHQGGSGRGSDATSRHWTARALDHPFGKVLVIGAGLLLIAYGVYQCYRASGSKLSEQLNFASTGRETRTTLMAISRFGVAARGVIAGVIGTSLIRAAMHRDSSDAKGISGALRQLATLPMGSWILTAAGLGLASYGIYALINARYRRIRAT